jgi:hypothetical protein
LKKHFFIFIVAFLPALSALAKRPTKSKEIGVFLGGSYYIGDLNPMGHFNFTRPAGGAIFRYNFNPRASFRASFLMGTIEGYDSFSSSKANLQRNLSFQSSIAEVSAQLEFNFLDYEIGNDKHKFSPYIFLGLAGFRFNPQAEYNNTWQDLQPLGTEGQGLSGGPSGYSLIQVSIPFGVGIKANLSNKIGLTVEWGMRKTFTDYLDDVSTKYYSPAALTVAHGAAAGALSDPSIGTDPNYSNVGRQRGNASTDDWYSFAGIIISFKLNQKVPKCPGVN